MNLHDILEVDIIDYDYLGLGIAKIGSFPIFVEKALVGERVKIEITQLTKNLAKARVIDLINKSPNRNQINCPFYHECGGCDILHMCYQEQLKFKKQMVKTTFKKVANLEPVITDVYPNPNIYNYRNKIIVPFGVKDGKIVSGFYEKKSHNIIENDSCLIENKNARIYIQKIKELAKKYNISIYDESLHKGLLRNVMIRVTSSNDYMVVLVVLKDDIKIRNLAKDLFDEFAEIKSLYLDINDKKTNVILNSDGFIHLFGEEFIVETINKLKFEVHPNSFLQVNHAQAENMYNKALEYVDYNNNQTIIDAYCGIGSITLNLASKAKEVYGIEVVREAIDNANINKKINNISNAHFICGKCEDEISKLTKLKKVDTIVFDPPRKGCDKKFLDTVISMNINKIIYISCLTSSLARDAKYLTENGYILKIVHPFDLFSHSSHTENIAVFERK